MTLNANDRIAMAVSVLKITAQQVRLRGSQLTRERSNIAFEASTTQEVASNGSTRRSTTRADVEWLRPTIVPGDITTIEEATLEQV